MRMLVPALAMAVALASVTPAFAQETRVAPEGHVPPDASVTQLDWLIGQWEGEGIGGHRAMESWLPPTGDTMVGTFVQTDEIGGVYFTEHMYLMADGESLALRLKHFNPDLTGWEDKDDMVTFRLVALEPCAAYFSGLTLRCADSENPGEGLVAAVRMRSEGGDISELVFQFDRAAEPAMLPNSCTDAATTLDLNDCYAGLLAQAEARQAEYLDAAIERRASDAELVRRIRDADEAFATYRDAECGAVYQFWIEGSIRNVMALTCRIAMTDRRTHRIWQNWLTYMDSTPPILPEPEPML